MTAVVPPYVEFCAAPTYDASLLRLELIRDEGRIFWVYHDEFGHRTWGIGHNMASPRRHASVDQVYEDDCRAAEAALDEHHPWWRTLDPTRQRAMMGMEFQLGIKGMSRFVRFLVALQAHDYELAAAELETSKYDKQNTGREHRYDYMILNGTVEPGTF